MEGARSPEKQRDGWSAAYLAAIIDSSDDAIIGKTLDGTIRSWNAGAERLYGYTTDEVVGQSISILVPPDRPNELPVILSRLARGERIEHYQTNRVRKDGQQVRISVTISPVRDADGRIVGASAIARDITEQDRAIQTALRLREDFISIAAHELRTPLTTVYARLQLAERRVRRPDYDPAALQRDLAIVLNGADRLRGLLESLLDVSRIRSGRFELNRQTIDVVALTRRLAVELGENAGRDIVVRGPSSAREPANVDAVRIEEVLTNLIDNAIKYSSATQPIDIDIAEESSYVRIAVSDRGPGVPPEERERIFEPFHRVNRDAQGVGLGLHVAREIVRLHDGSLVVEERPGGGATFVLVVPKVAARAD
jgi:two-component system, chemotaxis family, CheB/CheR fusion protein